KNCSVSLSSELPAAVGKPGWAKAGLRKVGALVERHGWVAWVGAILVGVVAGLLWALDHAAPAEKDQTRPVIAPGQETADRREGQPATPPPSPLLPPTPRKEPEPPASGGGGPPQKPVPTPQGQGPPLLTSGEF